MIKGQSNQELSLLTMEVTHLRTKSWLCKPSSPTACDNEIKQLF